jgi:hypothetical protein
MLLEVIEPELRGVMLTVSWIPRWLLLHENLCFLSDLHLIIGHNLRTNVGTEVL